MRRWWIVVVVFAAACAGEEPFLFGCGPGPDPALDRPTPVEPERPEDSPSDDDDVAADDDDAAGEPAYAEVLVEWSLDVGALSGPGDDDDSAGDDDDSASPSAPGIREAPVEGTLTLRHGDRSWGETCERTFDVSGGLWVGEDVLRRVGATPGCGACDGFLEFEFIEETTDATVDADHCTAAEVAALPAWMLEALAPPGDFSRLALLTRAAHEESELVLAPGWSAEELVQSAEGFGLHYRGAAFGQTTLLGAGWAAPEADSEYQAAAYLVSETPPTAGPWSESSFWVGALFVLRL